MGFHRLPLPYVCRTKLIQASGLPVRLWRALGLESSDSYLEATSAQLQLRVHRSRGTPLVRRLRAGCRSKRNLPKRRREDAPRLQGARRSAAMLEQPDAI